MNWIFNAIAAVSLSMLAFESLDACTAFQLQSQDGAHLYCRSMEYSVDLKSNILIAPTGSDYQGTAPDNQTGLKWKSIYGFVGINQWFAPNVVTDGMNEKGLVVGVLYLPRYAEYEKPDPKLANATLGAWELATYLLGTCASLDEVRSALPKVLVAQQPIPGTNFSLPLHFYIGDSAGKVLVVEYVKGQRYVHDNPYGALTNAPPFDWQVDNLSNYVSLSPVNVPEMDLNGIKIPAVGQGSGLTGIPGDYTPLPVLSVQLYTHIGRHQKKMVMKLPV